MCFYQEKHALQPPPESSLLCRCFFNVEILGLWSNWVIYTKLVFSVRARTESHVVVNKRSMELEEQVDALIYDFLCSTCWWNIYFCHLFPLFDVCLFSYFLLLYLTENDLSVLLMVIIKVCGENIDILLLRPGSDEDVFKRNIVTMA